ncbi:MAG: hypothetical protein LBQ83_04985 [Candidatus Margulisbacteria bacterium]|jgi:hypothetical protein|nr:hypothetical protein [Candidatus Margulisiibacteriota bacterium]
MLLPKFENLELGAACELLCPACPHWPDSAPRPAGQLQSRAWLVNLCGGDPLAHPDLAPILVALKKNRQLVTLTTCGYRLGSLEPKLLLLIDFIFLYVPACSGEKAFLRTGLNSWPRQLAAIEYLQESKKKFAVLHPVAQDTLADLPELHARLAPRGSYLILLRNKKAENAVPRREKAYLYYYGRRPNTLVYEYRQNPPDNCLDFARQLGRPSLYNLWSGAKMFYKFLFLS